MARPAAAGQQQQVAVLVVVVVVMLMMPSVVVRVSAVSCGQVAGYVTPCISYAMGKGTAPSEACCSGIRNLNAAAAATADRQATCKCLKQITAAMPALKPDLVAGIPSKCGVDVPYPIARSTDCNKVQ